MKPIKTSIVIAALTFILFTICVAPASSADKPRQNSTEMAPPEPSTQQLTFLKSMAGNYTVSMNFDSPDGQFTGSGTGSYEALPAVHGVQGSIKMTLSNGQPYEEHDLFGFQGGDKSLHLLALTSDPAAHDHVITLKDNGNFSFRWQGKQDGKSSTEEVTCTWVSPNEMHADQIIKVDGRKFATGQLVFKRSDQAYEAK